jgi:protein-disulfide isomerase
MIPKSGIRFSDKIMRQQESTEFQLHITRREFCKSTATIALATVALGAFALPPFPSDALAENIPVSDLMKPDAMPDLALGDDKAPVTIVEYASMTCPHCAHFQEVTFPEIKKRYIDTGKVRYILRDFPLDNLSGAAFVLAHCAAKDDKNKYYSLVDTLFSQQRQWAVEKPIPPLMAIAKQAGLTEASFNACLTNQKAWDAMESVRQRAATQFKVQSTPTFFVNGTKVDGAVTIEEFAKVIDPYLKGG